MEKAIRVLAFNNYDIKSIYDQWNAEGQNAPSQHLWGCPELQQLGYAVTYMDYDSSAALKSLSRKTKVLGDLDLQKRVLDHASQYDVIYCGHQPTVSVLALLRSIGLLKTPLVAVGYQSPRSISTAYRMWTRAMVGGLDRLLCLSEAMEADFLQLGMRPDRLGQIRWGVDLRHYSFTPKLPVGDLHFVSVGKSFRDFHSLIHGFPFDKARLTIMGAGKSIDVELPPEAVGRLEIHSGWIDWPEFAKMLPVFHGLVLPIVMDQSRGNNAIGLTAVTEALASGLPVIATHNPYIGIDLEAEQVGHWVQPGDPNGWRAAITAVYENTDKAAQMRCDARKLAETRININVFAATLDQTFRAVASRT